MSRRNRIIAGVAIVLAIAVTSACGSDSDSGTKGSTGSSTKTPSQQTRPVSVTGERLPEFQSGGADDGVGKTIPTISGQSFAGETIKIEPGGKAKVLLGVAHWCPHCQREVPLLSASIRANPLPANVEMTAISTSVNPSAPNYPPETWLKKEQWPTPVMADDKEGTAAKAIGLTGFPYFVFVDAQGKVAARASGEMAVSQFRAIVDKLAAGQPISTS